MGLCGVQVYNLTREDSGKWGCRMGVKDAAEVITKYTVEIYGNILKNLFIITLRFIFIINVS